MHKHNDTVDKLQSLAAKLNIQRHWEIEDIDPLKKQITTKHMNKKPKRTRNGRINGGDVDSPQKHGTHWCSV